MSGGFDSESGSEPNVRLTVRKDLFPEIRLPKLVPVIPNSTVIRDDLDDVSCVMLETDFEQSIDDIARQKLQFTNGVAPASHHSKRRKRSRHHNRHMDEDQVNGLLSDDAKKYRSHEGSSRHKSKRMSTRKKRRHLQLVSSSRSDDDNSSDNEVLNNVRQLPAVPIQRPSGKPYSHELSQFAHKKKKKKSSESKHPKIVVPPCSGKPRSMLSICSSKSKKKRKKSPAPNTYQSQIMDASTIKIKIQKTSLQIQEFATAVSALVGQKKPKKKKKKCSTPVSESSGEEYDPSQGDKRATTVAVPKPRNRNRNTQKNVKVVPVKNKGPKKSRVKSSNNLSKSSNSQTKASLSQIKSLSIKVEDIGPQSPWGDRVPAEVLLKIFSEVVASQGSLPTVIRLGKVCKLWHQVSCDPSLWRHLELSQYTKEKMKTDYKLVWLLENRLSMCQTLNLGSWKVTNTMWILGRLGECCPQLVELSLASWSWLTGVQLRDLALSLPRLQRLDLSFTSETGGSGSCLSAASMANLTEVMGERLTHLTLANNLFSSLQQILTSISTQCSRLEVLDISGARATSHPAFIPLEALQRGCPLVRIFRAANAQLVLAPPAPAGAQMEAPCWSVLEELSIASEESWKSCGMGEYQLNEEALARLVRGATRLRLLDLRGLQRLSDSGLVRVPAWDLQHLFLGGCKVTRQPTACLELICQKWSHSLIELDLSWAAATEPLDAAVEALAERAEDSKLRTLNLCGSSVSFEPVRKVILKCPLLESINLSSCRALPRGIKRLYVGKELQDLKDSLDPAKAKAKEDSDESEDEKSTDEKKVTKRKADSKCDSVAAKVAKENESKELTIDTKEASPLAESNGSIQTPESVPENRSDDKSMNNKVEVVSPDSKSLEKSQNDSSTLLEKFDGNQAALGKEMKDSSPSMQSHPDSSCAPKQATSKHPTLPSPLPKPDSQATINSPDIQNTSTNNSWNLEQFRKTPSHKSEASPLNKEDSLHRPRPPKSIEQCSPTTSNENKLSPESMHGIKNPNSWGYGGYSPMPRQDNQIQSQRSPYSAQPSPAQPSPYSAQPSPYSTQPSPYSSQPSPYSAQPSPDTSQIAKPELTKASSSWNIGSYSPMTKNPTQYSPHPSTHTSPDPTMGMKADSVRNSSKAGQYSPMSRQERHLQSPYSPRPSVETPGLYSNKKSPAMGSSPMVRTDSLMPSPDSGLPGRTPIRPHDLYPRIPKPQEIPISNTDMQWNMDRFGQGVPVSSNTMAPWSTSVYTPDPRPVVDNSLLNQSQQWPGLPHFDSGLRSDASLQDPWSVGQFRVEPPHMQSNSYIEQSINFDALAHMNQAHMGTGFGDDSFSEASRVD